MRHLSTVVEHLRRVNEARRRFMELWAVEHRFVNPMLHRIAEDLVDPIAGDSPRDPTRDGSASPSPNYKWGDTD